MNRSPRVLHVGKFYAPHRGGIETHLQFLCTELRKYADVRVLVASGERRGSEEIIDGVPVTRAATPFSLASAPLCPGMIRAIHEAQADIVHLHVPNPSAIMAYLASGHQGALVCTYHSDTVRQKILGPLFEPIMTQVLKRCDAIIVSSPNYIDSSPVVRRYKHLCHVIPFGIPVDEFERADHGAVREIRERYGPNMIMSVGRHVYYKGFQFLIEAMERVNGKLVLIGDGPLRGECENLIRTKKLEDKVFILGRVEDVVPFYHASQLFVLPSIARSEAFGIVQIEAMACGKPVVNTNLDSGVPFVSLDGVSGLTVPPGDTVALAAAINTLLGDDELRARYGAAARRRVDQLFTLEAMTNKMLDLYEQVCPRFANVRTVMQT